MKIINIKFYLSFFGILIFMSCNKLDDLPPNTLIAENAIKNEATAETAVNGLYSYFGDYGELNALSITTQSLRTNFLEPSSLRGTYEIELTALAVDPSWVYTKNLWVSIFELVNASNFVINQLNKFDDKDFSPGKRMQLLSEARFIRAYAHLYEMKMFAHFWDIQSEYGPLIRLKPAGLNNNAKARSSVKEGYDIILEDLRFAAENGPDFFSIYRSSKSLAKAYIVEALLMRGIQGDYAEAAGIANEIIQNGPFTLAPTFEEVYSEGYESSELMFSRVIKPENIGLQDLIAGNIASVYSLLGREGNAPTDTYFEQIPPDEARFQYIIGDAVASNGVEYEDTWIKHFNISGDVPMRFMRLTQMYLYKAEALYRSGASISSVLEPLNVLRLRGDMPEYSASEILDYGDLEEIIFYELLVEVGVENGSDYFAAVRFRNDAGERLLKEFNPAYENDNQLVLPIPADELLFNSAMKQNP